MSSLNQFTDLENEDTTPERQSASKRTTWVSVVVNVFLSAVQVTAGLFSGSQALISDGIHSLSDLISDFVVLFAIHHGQKEADEDHQYGHQRFENAATLVLGAILIIVGLGMIWVSVLKLQNPQNIPVDHVAAIWVALIALIAKEGLFRYMLLIAEKVGSGLLVANAWHARSDAASSMVVALGIVANLMGFPLLDPVAALIVGFMVSKMGWGFLWGSLNDLTDRAASEEQISAISSDILATPGVLGLHQLKTRKTGDMILADVHLEIDGDLTVREGHEIARQARLNVMARHPVLYLMTHVDPVNPSSYLPSDA